jgi:hypothetical protein
MSSEHLASAKNTLKGNLGGNWNILDGASGQYQDLGVARRFGGAAAAYSLRDIGAMNGKVVRVRREPHDTDATINDEADFSASQVASGSLEDWVNGKQEGTLPADFSNPEDITQFTLSGIESDFNDTYTVVGSSNGKPKWRNSSESDIEIQYRSDGKWEIDNDGDEFYISDDIGLDYPWAVTSWTADQGSPSNTPTFSLFVGGDIGASAAYSLRKVKSDYSGNAVRIRRSSDDVEVDVAFDSDDKVSLNSLITNVAEQGGESGQTTSTTLNQFLNDEHESTIGHFGAGATFYHLNISNVTKDGVVAKKYSASEDATGTNQFLAVNNSAFDVRGGSGVVDSTRSKAVYKFRYYVDSTESPNVNYFHFKSQSGGGSANFTEGTVWEVVKDSWQTLTLTLPAGQAGMSDAWYIFISDRSTNQKPSAGSITIGDGFYITPTHQVTFSNTTAFVHTWYNQSGDGSNGATQATSTKQPKIASVGTLLDHLLFDGTDDFLADTNVTFEGAVSLACVSEKAANGLYPLSAARQGAANRFFAIQEQSATSTFIARNSASQQVSTDTGGDKRLTFARTNSDTSYSVASMGRGLQTGTSDYGAAPSASLINQVVIGSRETGSSGTPSVSTWNGKIFEAITYQTDQTDNKFKIESNINNYYDLYNDAKELTEDFEGGSVSASSVSGQTFVANGKDGFTVTTSSSAVGEGGFTTVANVLAYKISFNAKLNGNSVNIARRINKHSSGAATQLQALTEGFNTYDYASAGSGNYQALTFTCSDNNATFTISDFKISGIARNGFVETWYDQSGNNRPLIQTTATEQPSIVENGGFVGGVKANVATSNSTMQNLQVSTDGVNANFGTDDLANGGTKLGLMYVGSIPDTPATSSTCVIWGSGRGVSGYQAGGVSLQIVKGGNDDWILTNEREGLSPALTDTITELNSDTDVICYGTTDNRDFVCKVNASSTSETQAADLDVREDQAISLFGAYSGGGIAYYQRSTSGICKECYLFSGDNIVEVDTISTEINNHYNIYT